MAAGLVASNPVDAQLAAYNAQDLDAYCACFTEDIVIEDGAGKAISRGKATMRENYARMFAAHPDNHCDILHRIAVGDFVIDHERISGRGPEPFHAVAVYRIAGGLIQHVRFLK